MLSRCTVLYLINCKQHTCVYSGQIDKFQLKHYASLIRTQAWIFRSDFVLAVSFGLVAGLPAILLALMPEDEGLIQEEPCVL